jgi:hypothetical protein
MVQDCVEIINLVLGLATDPVTLLLTIAEGVIDNPKKDEVRCNTTTG